MEKKGKMKKAMKKAMLEISNNEKVKLEEVIVYEKK